MGQQTGFTKSGGKNFGQKPKKAEASKSFRKVSHKYPEIAERNKTPVEPLYLCFLPQELTCIFYS